MSFIQKLDLSEEEKDIYKLLLVAGGLNHIEIIHIANIHRSKVKEVLQSLVDKKLLESKGTYLKKYYPRIPLEHVRDKSETISEKLASLTEELIGEIQKNKEIMENKQLAIHTNLENTLKEKKEQIATAIDEEKKKISERETVEKNRLVEEKQELITTLEHKQQEKVGSTEQTITQQVDQINTLKERFEKELLDAKQAFETAISQLVAKTIEENQSSVTEKRSEIQREIQPIKPSIDELQNKALNDFSKIMDVLQTNMDLNKLDINSFSDEQIASYNAFSKEITDEAQKSVEASTELIDTQMNNLKSSMDQLMEVKLGEMEQDINKTMLDLKTRLLEAQKTMIDDLKQNKDSTIATSMYNTKNALAVKITDIQNLEQQQRNKINSDKAMFETKLKNHYTQTQTQYNETLEGIKAEFKGQMAEFKENIGTILANFSEKTSEVFNEQSTAYQTLLSKTKDKMVQNSEEKTTLLNSALNEISEKNLAVLNENKERMNQYFNDMNTLLKEKIEEMGTRITSFVDINIEETNNLMQEAFNRADEELTEGSNILENGVKQEVEAARKYIDTSEEKMKHTSKELLTIATEMKEEFGSLSTIVSDDRIPIVETGSIIGIEAVKEQMETIIKNTKRGVTILVPEVDYVPIEIIKQLPRTAQVTIVANIDMIKDKEWIRDAFSADANVIVRAIRDSGVTTGVEAPRFIGVEREGEEVLIAAEDEKTKEIVGIISKSTAFSKIMSYIVIGDYARGRSSQIRREEVQ